MRTRAELLVGVLASAGLVVLVSAVVALLKPHVPVLSLGALYVLAVLPVAIFWGTALAAVVSVVSMLVFNWFFLPPYHSFNLQEGQNWLALAVYLAIAFAVGALAARARARRDDAEQRRAEAHALAEAALDLLRGRTLDEELGRLAALTAGRARRGGRETRARRTKAGRRRASVARRGRAALRGDALPRRGGDGRRSR